LKEQELLEQLVNLARSLDFDVRFDCGSFQDGSCRLPQNDENPQDRNLVLLNRASSTVKKVATLSRALGDQPLEGIFLLPAVREAIERERRNSLHIGNENRPAERDFPAGEIEPDSTARESNSNCSGNIHHPSRGGQHG